MPRSISTSATGITAYYILQMDDVRRIVRIYDYVVKEFAKGDHYTLEVLKKAGIVLAVTTWESFIEEMLQFLFTERLDAASLPSDIESTFNSVAHAWLSGDEDVKPRPPDLAKWAGTGWKSMLLDKFNKDISELNTPNSIQIRKLSKRYLAFDLTTIWKWRGVSPQRACSRLDTLIKLRGALVHGGSDASTGKRVRAHRRQLVGAIELVDRLAECIASHAGAAFDLLPVKIDI